MKNTVTVTAADFNGSSWDGSPFTAFPAWLRRAVDERKVQVKPGSEDYAWWEVQIRNGRTVVGPGDEIICDPSTNELSVKHKDDSAHRRFKHHPNMLWPVDSN